MATIVVTSTSGHQTQETEQHYRISVAALYSNGTKTYHRDPLDVCLDVLKCLIRGSKITHIRNAAKITTPALCKRYVALLCRFGLIIEVKTTKKNRCKNKKTDKKGISVIRRYYITPKGNAFIRLFDAMTEVLISSFLH